MTTSFRPIKAIPTKQKKFAKTKWYELKVRTVYLDDHQKHKKVKWEVKFQRYNTKFIIK